ncbi:MAG: tyrosine-type recombinase/integrase [Deltaproteobacteria bacterium]|nr:tyrosine-type recombinase/integrase [Deltaproteobacteria bacterium]
MKNFESFLAPQLDEYLAYRKSLGFRIDITRHRLLIFDQYLRRTNAEWDSFQPFFFLEMRAHLDNESRSINRIISSIRVFFKFLLRREYVTENPLQDIPPLKENNIVPFVFSPAQIDQLLKAASESLSKSKCYFLARFGKYTALLLLARCGMRISEPIGLMRQHYRKDDGTLYIEKTKFKKQRLIPVPKSVMTGIENYLSVRRTLLPNDQNPYLLAAKDQKPFTDQQVRFFFQKAVKAIGLDQTRKVIGNLNVRQPTPHALRHSFAVNTLIKIKKREGSPQHALPVLAAYMGHSEYKHTSVYLRVADAVSRDRLVDFALWQRRKE